MTTTINHNFFSAFFEELELLFYNRITWSPLRDTVPKGTELSSFPFPIIPQQIGINLHFLKMKDWVTLMKSF